MKNLLLAAALAFVPTASQAAVTINFSGVTFAYDPSQPQIGSYEEVTASDGSSSTSIDTGPQDVSGSLIIDTALAGANGATPPDALYSGKNFIKLTFASSGVTPTVLTGVSSEQSIDSVDGSLTFRLFDEADRYAYTFQLFGIEPIPTSIFDGILLPDFTKADSLFFVAVSGQDVGDTSVLRVSSGFVTAIAQTVPEPATWAMMLVGFGLVGTALRRRERITVRFA
ncbi:PEPxxWA-CTERM sorting domain-containing protein [Sphingomonas sp. Tas61C01]|uniref:PEPxxWA-CTERM sorting domain-containing protein n=1 Tax=Sphingomonas sp. Tas61C01 TaxID=3458297 RepID=UPI00403EEF34